METEASINDLRRAVEGLHACSASHRETVQVREDFKGQTVWDGVIHVFDLQGHPAAKIAYAWSSHIEGSDRRRFYAVLHIPPVDSREAAVRRSPSSPQSSSPLDPASIAAAINAATQALQATNITSQLAITSSKEVMEKNKAYYEELAAKNKSYYEDMTTKLLWAAAAFAFFVSAGGVAVIWLLTKQRINRMTRKAVRSFKEQFDAHIDKSSRFHEETQQFRNETVATLNGFLLLTPMFNQLTNWSLYYGHLEASERDKKKTDMLVEGSLQTCKEAIELGPTNTQFLGMAYSMKGVALAIDNRLSAAYDACKTSVEYHEQSGKVYLSRAAPLYNMACMASLLGNREKAIQHLRAAIGVQPSRAEQARVEGDFRMLLDDPEFRSIVRLPPKP